MVGVHYSPAEAVRTISSTLTQTQLPLTLLRAASGAPLLVELKNGDTYNGRLLSCDTFMNLNLTDVICTAADGERFWKLPTCYIRGSAIKYLRLPPELMDQAEDMEKEELSRGGGRGRGRGRDGGGRGGRGGGRGRDGRGRGRGRGGRGGGRGEGGRGEGGGREGRGRGGGGRKPTE